MWLKSTDLSNLYRIIKSVNRYKLYIFSHTRLDTLLPQPFDHEETNYSLFKSFLNSRHSFTWEYFSMPRNPPVTLWSVIYNRAILEEPSPDGASRTEFLGSTREREGETYTHIYTRSQRSFHAHPSREGCKAKGCVKSLGRGVSRISTVPLRHLFHSFFPTERDHVPVRPFINSGGSKNFPFPLATLVIRLSVGVS